MASQIPYIFSPQGCVDEIQVLTCSDPSAAMTIGPRDYSGNNGTVRCRNLGFYTDSERLLDGKKYKVFCSSTPTITSTTTDMITSTSSTSVTTTALTTIASTTTTAIPSTLTTFDTTTVALGSEIPSALALNTTTDDPITNESSVTSSAMTDNTTPVTDSSTDIAGAADNNGTSDNSKYTFYEIAREYKVISSSTVRAGNDVTASGIGGYRRKSI